MGVTAGIVGSVAGVAGAVNGIANSGKSSGQANADGAAADALKQKAADLWNNLQTPSLNTTPYKGQTWLQDYTPETYDPYIGSVTQMSDDPAAKAAQLAALSQLQGFAKGGLQPADMIALNQINQQQAGAASSNAAAAADALRSRGLGGAGAEYASRLAANQQAANSTSNLYDNAMQAAMTRQLNATTQAGGLAGNIRSQSDNVSQQMANIANNFNTQVQNLRTNAAQNAATVRNQAQAANLTGRQAVANQNVTTGNQNLDRTNQLAQQDFSNQQAKITGQSNAYNGQATNLLAQQAAANQQELGNSQSITAGLSGLMSGLKAIGGTNNTNQNANNNTNTNTSQNGSSSNGSPSWYDNLFGSNQNYVDNGSF